MMRIQIDNTVRDMTKEEEEKYIEMHTHLTDPANEDDYIIALNSLGVDTNEED